MIPEMEAVYRPGEAIWERDPEYRTRMEANPREALTEQGVEVPKSLDVRVVANDADTMHFVFSARPERGPVGRGALIGERRGPGVVGGQRRLRIDPRLHSELRQQRRHRELRQFGPARLNPAPTGARAPFRALAPPVEPAYRRRSSTPEGEPER